MFGPPPDNGIEPLTTDIYTRTLVSHTRVRYDFDVPGEYWAYYHIEKDKMLIRPKYTSNVFVKKISNWE